jgi:hypothetical protein
MKSKPTTPIPVRISDQTLKELERIGVEQDRAVGWLIRFACDFLVDAYKKDPDVVRPASRLPSAPAPPFMAAIAETEWFQKLVAKVAAELEAGLDQPAELAAEPKAEPKADLDRKPAARYRLVLRDQSSPKGEAHPAVAVPETQISKHSVNH